MAFEGALCRRVRGDKSLQIQTSLVELVKLVRTQVLESAFVAAVRGDKSRTNANEGL